MQATALGRYLLYRPDGTFVTPAGVSADAGRLGVSVDAKTLTRRADHVTPATGCAEFPEAPLNATGTPSKGATEFGRVGGAIDGHMHWMTYEYFGGRFHCGKPWDAFGITFALPDCAAIEGPGGTAAVFQNFLNYGNPAAAARHARLPVPDRDEGEQPHARGHVLALGAARLDGRAAADGDEHQREPRAVHAAAGQGHRLRRDGDRAPRARRHPRRCRTTSTRRPAGRARASSRSSPTRTRRGG